MKKSFLRLLPVLCLVLMLCLGFLSGRTLQVTADAEGNTEYVYKSDFTTIKTPDPDNGLSLSLYTGDGYYGIGSVVVGQREPAEGEVEQYEGELDIRAAVLYFVDLNGNCEKLPDFEPILPAENTGNYRNFYSNVVMNRPLLNADGNLVSLLENYQGYYDGPAEALGTDAEWEYFCSENRYELAVFSPTGKLLSRTPLEVGGPEVYLNGFNTAFDPQGNLLATLDEGVFAFGTDGLVAYQIPSEEYISSLLQLSDGRIGALVYTDVGLELRILDFENRQFAESYPMPEGLWSARPGESGYDLYYTSGTDLFGFKLGADAPEKLLNWMSADINGDMVDPNTVNIAADGTVVGVAWNYETGNSGDQIFTLSLVPLESVPAKEILTVAQLQYSDSEMNNRIVKFNRSHDGVRLELKDYSQYNTETDPEGGAAMFVADLMAGEGADIIPMDGLNYQQLAAKGLLEDLYPYIDEDPEMDREDFFPNLLDALTVDGGLYQAVSGFSVQTLAGAASIVGNTPGWTYEDYYAALAAMPEGCTPLDIWSTKDVVLNSMLYVVLNDLVDWSTGEVRFDSPEFRQMLEFVNSFPESYDWENYDMMETAEQRVRQGRQMLMQVGLYSPESLLWSDMDLSGRATFVGWPTSEGVGSAMSLTTGYAISRTCENKDAAWEFLRDQLTEQGQDNTWLIPTNRNVFDRKLAELMEVQYLQDADGNDLQDDNGEKILQPRGSWYDGSNEEHVVYSLTQEQADEILEMIETCTRVTNYDMGLINIVCETAQDYFEGRSSLDDVCSRIQDAVSLYIGK